MEDKIRKIKGEIRSLELVLKMNEGDFVDKAEKAEVKKDIAVLKKRLKKLEKGFPKP